MNGIAEIEELLDRLIGPEETCSEDCPDRKATVTIEWCDGEKEIYEDVDSIIAYLGQGDNVFSSIAAEKDFIDAMLVKLMKFSFKIDDDLAGEAAR